MRTSSAQSLPFQSRTARIGTLTLLIAMLGWGTFASAQAPFVVTGLTYTDLKADKPKVEAILKDGGAISGEDLSTFDDYFSKYFLPPMALVKSTAKVVKPPHTEIRANLRKYFLFAKQGPAYDRLNEITLAMMKFLLKKFPTHPELVANAVLIIGDLNENDLGSGKTKPLPEGLKFLVSLLNDPKLPDIAYVEALVGIQRHIEYQNAFPIPKETKDQLVKVLVDNLKQKQPPASRTPSGQAWIRRLSGEMLALLGDPGVNGANVEAILVVVQDPETPTLMRCSLSSYLGKFKYPPNAKIDYGKLAVGIGHAVLDAARRELARVEKMNAGGAGGILVSPDTRRLSVYFHQALMGLKGPPPSHKGGLLAAAVGSPNVTNIQEIATNVEKINTFIVKAITDSYEVDPVELTEMLSSLEAALPKPADVAKLPARAGGADQKLPTN